MNDRVELVFAHHPGEERLIANIALDKSALAAIPPTEAGGQIVEHHDLFARIDQGVDHVAADIAGAAGHQNCHDIISREPSPTLIAFHATVFGQTAENSVSMSRPARWLA